MPNRERISIQELSNLARNRYWLPTMHKRAMPWFRKTPGILSILHKGLLTKNLIWALFCWQDGSQ